jgi:hypothetical protein
MERMRNLPWRFVLRSLAGAAGVCITVLGFVSIFTISAFSERWRRAARRSQTRPERRASARVACR